MMKRILGTLLILSVFLPSLGCTYAQNRVSDLGEIIDLGLTFSAEPQFACYVIFPPCMLTPIGYGEVDGRFMGLGGGELHAWSPYYEKSIGLILWGEETVSFDMNEADLVGLSEAELRDKATFYRSGPAGIAEGPMTNDDYLFSCPHYVHLGFVGFVLSPRYYEMMDFVLGFTHVVDISFDDSDWPTPSPVSE